jgi:hypothetical protein
MEPSLSLDASIVLRTGQDESRYGTRVVFDSASGAIRSDHEDAVPEGPAPATLRAVAGRWLFDAASETRVSINGVAVGGAGAGRGRRHHHRRLPTSGGRGRGGTLALRRFDLVGNDTLPPVGTACACSRRRPKIWPSIPGCPEHRRFVAPRIQQRFRNTAERRRMGDGWSAGRGARRFAMLKPIAPTCALADAVVKSVGSFSQSASSVFVFPGEHRLRAEREG